jgi:hypothetical protein
LLRRYKQLLRHGGVAEGFGQFRRNAPRLFSGAFSSLRHPCCQEEIVYAGRNASASPAVGAFALHKRVQPALIAEAFAL